MAATTVRLGPKPFTWSYSRLKNFEQCPKRYFDVDVEKRVREEETEQLKWGNEVHKHMAARCGSGHTPLPPGYEQYEHWCSKAVTPPGNILVEQRLALTRDFAPCEFFAPDVWFRGIGDIIKLCPPVALTLDWKTGKILEDSVQLALTAACIFAKYPEIKRIRSEFIWLKENATTREDFTPADMPGLWRAVLPRVAALERSHNTTTFPAMPGRLCKKYCPVTDCGHWGKAHG